MQSKFAKMTLQPYIIGILFYIYIERESKRDIYYTMLSINYTVFSRSSIWFLKHIVES